MKTELLKRLSEATKENPVSRYTEAYWFNTTERNIRNAIQELRMEGHRICSDSSGNGYWLAKSEGEYKRFRAEYASRAKKIFEVVGRMDASTEGQMQIGG